MLSILLAFLLILYIDGSSAGLSLGMVRYCLVKTQRTPGEQFRLIPIPDYTLHDFTTDQMITQTLIAPYKRLYFFTYTNSPSCIVGFTQPSRETVEICESMDNEGYYYHRCGDGVPYISIMGFKLNSRTKSIGHFIGNKDDLRNNTKYTAVFGSMNNYDINTPGHLRPTLFMQTNVGINPTFPTVEYTSFINSVYNSMWSNTNPPWSALFFGVNDYPSISHESSLTTGTSVQLSEGNRFEINNCLSESIASFKVTDKKMTQTSKQSSINQQSSSDSTWSRNVQVSVSTEFLGSSSSFSVDVGQSHTTSRSRTLGTTQEVEESKELTSFSSFEIPSNTKVAVTELLHIRRISTTHKFTFNGIVNNIVQDSVEVVPAGYVSKALNCL